MMNLARSLSILFLIYRTFRLIEIFCCYFMYFILSHVLVSISFLQLSFPVFF